MKLLLYCTKAKPYLLRDKENKAIFLGVTSRADRHNYDTEYGMNCDYERECCEDLNGKIVAECDYEVEEIIYNYLGNPFHDFYGMQLHTKALKESEISQHSKLKSNELRKYLLRNEDDYISPLAVGYAIHIKNLHIFDKPKELRELYTNRIYTEIEDVYTDEIQSSGSEWVRPIKKAPQNMMRVWLYENGKWVMYILISIQSQWMCKILNREKTVEVRKKVLKEMLEQNG